MFEPAPTDGLAFRAATGLDANAIADVQAGVRRRLLRVFVRRGHLPGHDTRVMAPWGHGGGFPVDASAWVDAADYPGRERPLTGNFLGDHERPEMAGERRPPC